MALCLIYLFFIYHCFQTICVSSGYFAKKLAEFTTTKGVTTIIDGGDFVAAVEKAGLADKMSHIFLPGVLCLDDA